MGVVNEAKLVNSTDAMVWVEEWMKLMKENKFKALDRGTMLGWFANAIMAGWDEGARKQEAEDQDMMNGIVKDYQRFIMKQGEVIDQLANWCAKYRNMLEIMGEGKRYMQPGEFIKDAIREVHGAPKGN